MVINIHSDHILRNLRKPGETGYKIPRGKHGGKLDTKYPGVSMEGNWIQNTQG
jgi:hypothetical protein